MNSGKVNLLVLDDDADDREFIENVIKELGIDKKFYSIFSNREEFYSVLGKDVHVVILDLMIGPDDAFELFKEIKRINEGTFVIISTGYDDSETVRKYMNNDADRFASKNDFYKWKKELREFLITGFEVGKRNVDWIVWLRNQKIIQDEQRTN